MITLNFSQIFMIFFVVFMMLVILGVIFGLGVAIGRMMENSSRGVFGVKKGSIGVGAPGPDSEDPLGEFVGQQFMPDEWRTAGPQAKQGTHDPEEALKEVDRHVQRFIDNTVFGRGPVRGRTGGEEDDL